jgi:uncharacterized membrane protein
LVPVVLFVLGVAVGVLGALVASRDGRRPQLISAGICLIIAGWLRVLESLLSGAAIADAAAYALVGPFRGEYWL